MSKYGYVFYDLFLTSLKYVDQNKTRQQVNITLLVKIPSTDGLKFFPVDLCGLEVNKNAWLTQKHENSEL